MKKIIMLLSLLFVLTAVNAQTSIRINHNAIMDSMLSDNNYCCNKVLQFYYFIDGVAHGYNPLTDLITLKVEFGDGIDSTFTTTLYNDSLFSFSAWAPHHYANTGLVQIKVLAIAPDGKKDSIEHPNFLIGDACNYIKGSFYDDNNANCQIDGGESTFWADDVRLWYNNHDITNTSMMTWSGNEFWINAPVGFTYDLITTNNVNGVFCPAIQPITTVPSSGHNIGFQCENHFDLTGDLYGSGFRPGASNAYIWANVYNLGCLTMNNGKLKLLFDNTLLTPTTSNGAYTVVGDTIIWNFTGLNSYYLTQSYSLRNIYFNVSTQAQLGDTLCFKLIETPYAGDIDTSNNAQSGCWPIRSSWDPNDKQVTPQGEGPHGYILDNQNMIYRIRFQNCGNDYAENIYIIDTLDNDLAIETFAVLHSSHYSNTEFLGGNIVKFNFPYIYLPDSSTNLQGSNGYVTYSIRQKPDLPIGTKIKNTAYIYFDYNPAVVTNTTLNTINKDPDAISEIEAGKEIALYPNPTSGILHIVLPENVEGNSLELLNSYGQVIFSVNISNQLDATLDLSGYATGLYFIKLTTSRGSAVSKFVKE